MLEKELERKCLAMVKARGGRMPKWVSPGNDGVPDRILLMPGREVVFLEFKAGAGGRLSPLQRVWQRVLVEGGWRYAVVRTLEDLVAILDESR